MARIMRAGSVKMAPISSNTPPTTMPSRRNGKRISHTIGKRTSASRAAGQQRMRRIRKRRSFMVRGCLSKELYAAPGSVVPWLAEEVFEGGRKVSFFIAVFDDDGSVDAEAQ